MASAEHWVAYGTAREAAIMRAYTIINRVVLGGLFVILIAEIFRWIPRVSIAPWVLSALLIDQLVQRVWLRRIHQRGHKAIMAAGYRVCPGCGYSLDGLRPAGECPECDRDYAPEALKTYWDNTYMVRIHGIRHWTRISAGAGSTPSEPHPTTPEGAPRSADKPSTPSPHTPHTPPASPTPPPGASTN